ncbi:helix-turn-helix domain-containing protein [Aliiruegeria sabulilitoris]|uniref:helix-turn-helix domain-containing protein n=1 Tax=Aliiruegeria sabulilitoris TaxID=1510458 RepID=UPI00083289AB|nr:helix-turn-helix domain-containing protein [Aliiruegeria sabulilitoris]NDR55729.1 helix-turn-helix domain-containing protein [Pseudoruegeria sp. M32A2M]
MDKIEHSPLSHIPVGSLSLRLARSTIRMQHDAGWKIDKLNPVHDLIICLSGQISYQVGNAAEPVLLTPGDGMLIPALTRFRGVNAGDGPIVGIAQHFTLEFFRQGDLIRQMALRPVVRMPDWEVLEPLIRHFRQNAPRDRTTLAQHHQFMVLLLAYLEEAFVEWQVERSVPESKDHLSMQIMLVASRLSADPLGAGVEEALAAVPYNGDYFRRAFKERIGLTPQKYRELKRMEFAANRLGQGLSVKLVAAELGYADPYFFSRMFKRYLGASPSTYRGRPSRDGEG